MKKTKNTGYMEKCQIAEQPRDRKIIGRTQRTQENTPKH
jgi:hypothetical protein